MAIELDKVRDYALIGVVVILGVLAGAVYASKVGGEVTVLNMREGLPDSAEARLALENEAIEIALADPRVKPLTEGKEFTVSALLKVQFSLKFVENKTETYYAQWDGKNRAVVTIRYPDDTGYTFDVNITDRLVEEPRRVAWEDGRKSFKYLP